jgi:hypothetical protein
LGKIPCTHGHGGLWPNPNQNLSETTKSQIKTKGDKILPVVHNEHGFGLTPARLALSGLVTAGKAVPGKALAFWASSLGLDWAELASDRV